MSSLRVVNRIATLNVRAFSKGASKSPSGKASGASSPPPAAAAPAGINANVPGLSSNIVLPKSQPLGPGASSTGEYKVPEYYCYTRTSYHEAEVELAKYRCPQPNANRK